MALLPRSQILKDLSGRQLEFAVVTFFLGETLAIFRFRAFGLLVSALPWLVIGFGAYELWRALRTKPTHGVRVQRWRQRRFIAVGAAAIAVGIVLLFKPCWCDAVLWYIVAALAALSALNLLRMAFLAASERYFWWRLIGGGTALIFALLMLMKPRSGLSDALQLIGFFTLAWGVFQFAVPRFKD